AALGDGRRVEAVWHLDAVDQFVGLTVGPASSEVSHLRCDGPAVRPDDDVSLVQSSLRSEAGNHDVAWLQVAYRVVGYHRPVDQRLAGAESLNVGRGRSGSCGGGAHPGNNRGTNRRPHCRRCELHDGSFLVSLFSERELVIRRARWVEIADRQPFQTQPDWVLA